MIMVSKYYEKMTLYPTGEGQILAHSFWLLRFANFATFVPALEKGLTCFCLLVYKTMHTKQINESSYKRVSMDDRMKNSGKDQHVCTLDSVYMT